MREIVALPLNLAYLALLHVWRLTCRSARYEERFAAGDAGPADFEDCGLGSGARVRHRTEAATGVARCGAGTAGVVVPRAAPTGKSRPAGGGLEGNGDG